jgi:Holliday junction resolvase RusA-like endonuclease
MSVSFTAYGVAQPAGSKTVGFTKGGAHYVRDSAKGSAGWKKTVAQVAGAQMSGKPLLEGPLLLEVVFWMPRPKGHYGSGRNAEKLKPSAPRFPTVKPDATKLLRALEDALTGIVWRDDAQVVVQTVTKTYGEPARVEVYVVPILGERGDPGLIAQLESDLGIRAVDLSRGSDAA